MTTSFITPRAYAANLLFKTNFGSDAMLYAPNIAYSTAGWQDFASTDLLSGSIKPISVLGATTSGFDMIADAPVTSSTLGNYMTNEIQQVTGPAGNQVYALFQNLKKNNAGPPTNGASQDAFMLHRNGVKGDTGDFYYTYWFKFQSDLHTQLGTSGDDSWRVMSEWKTGKNGDDGDYRVGTDVIKDSSGHLYWHTQGDDIAGVQSQGNIYWIVDNTTVPVPVGKWFKYEVFLHRSSGGDGRYWAAVNGQKIVDHSGPNMGVNNLPINRLFFNNAYSGGKAPVQQWTTGLEIWNGFPCGVGVSCYNNTSTVDIIAPSAPSGLSATAGSSTKVNLAWTAATDNVGVTGYRIYRNGTEISTSAVTSFTDASIAGGTSYNYAVKAYDGTGNLSATSNTATVKTTTSAAINISSYYVENITANSAMINWTTNVPSTGIVYYGNSPTNLISAVAHSNLVTSHSVRITELVRRKSYYYKITAKDTKGNIASSPTTVFRTSRK